MNRGSSGERTAALLDPHPLWLDVLERLLVEQSFVVVGKASTADAGLRVVEEHRPDLLLAEVPLRDGDVDLSTIERARALCPAMKIVVLSASAEGQHVARAFAAGAVAYVLKTAHAQDVALAVRQAFDHSVYLAPAVVPPAPRPTSDPAADVGLTRRELELLRLVADGYSNAELARTLWITEQTVKFHLTNIYRKLGAGNRTEAARWAQVHGLLAPNATARPVV